MPWHSGLSVGIELIDEQHKELFRRADMLFEAGRKGQAKEYIGELMAFLDGYTKQHFKEEEAYMLRVGFPEYEEHKKIHAGFIQKLQELRKEYDASGGNLTVIVSANQLVIDWLTRHVSNMDRRIGEFVRKQGS